MDSFYLVNWLQMYIVIALILWVYTVVSIVF